GVVWYGGNRRDSNDASFQKNLGLAEAGVRSYLADGGNLLLAYRDVVGDGGGFSADFAADVLGIEEYFRDETGTTNIRLASRSLVGTSLVSAPDDTLQTTSSSPDADFFRLADDVDPLFWVEPGVLGPNVTPDQTAQRAYLGVLSERDGGRIALVTYLLSRSDGRNNAHAVGAALLRRVFGI
ncbi:MAG: hypothetical protein KC729_17850, partial [Candidatus Eisenbacteria bacterium]|nr:hypothetical protein [Candidatus Eisenbacteria bacterium]